jgi:hypothetical protein
MKKSAMKSLSILIISFLSTMSISAQDIAGQWYGQLKVQGIQLRLIFNITQTDKGLSATMDSPDQGAKGIPATASFEKPILKIEIPMAKIAYEGTLGDDGIIAGTFKQGGQSFPLNLSKTKIEKETYFNQTDKRRYVVIDYCGPIG